MDIVRLKRINKARVKFKFGVRVKFKFEVRRKKLRKMMIC